MTTPTALNWKSATPEQRNDACACFMPPSEVNPILAWHLLIGQHDMGALACISRKEADTWLSLLQTNRDDFERVMGKYCVWDKRLECQIVEHRRSLRYSDTPGGAWTLIEELKRQGYLIAIAARAGQTAISAERHDKPAIITQSSALSPQSFGFSGPEPFPELAAMLFLTLNNCRIDQ
jgi:hypothetical protein